MKPPISELANKTTSVLCNQRLNAMRLLNSEKHDEAVSLIDDIDEVLIARLAAPSDGWSSGAQGKPRYLMHSGDKVAVVIRSETHGKCKGAYFIEVLGQLLPETPRCIEDARILAEAQLTSRRMQ